MRKYPFLLLAAAAVAETQGGTATAPAAATKQTKSTTVPGQAKTAEQKAEAARKALGDVFKFEKDLDPAKKLAPQAQVILNTVKAKGKTGITRGDLIKACTGVIVTRQPVDRIITYYTPVLTKELGVVSLTKAA